MDRKISKRIDKKKEIFFIRHGAVENPLKISYGRLSGFPLSKKGVRQVHAILSYFDAEKQYVIYSGPRLRTIQTAEIISKLTKTPGIRISELLDEACTPFDGVKNRDMTLRNWDTYSGNEPPFENPTDVLIRARKFVAQVLANCSEQRIIAVTHGDIIAFLLLWLHSAQITPDRKQSLRLIGLPEDYPANTAILRLIYDPSNRKAWTPKYCYITPAGKAW